MRMHELLNATILPGDDARGTSGWITVRKHDTGGTRACILLFSDNRLYDLLR